MAIQYFVQKEGLYIAYGLSSDIKPSAPPDNALFNEIDTTNLFIASGGTWSLPTKHKIIKSINDFPTPISNIITLEDNTSYEIYNTINVSANTFVCGIKNTIFSLDRFNSSLISTTTGTMFNCDSSTINKFTLIFNNITVGCPNGTLFNFISNTANASLNLLDTTISSTKNLGNLTNFGGLTLTNTTVRNTITTNGFVISGTNTSIRVRFCVFENNTGTLLDLGTSTQNIIDINNNSIKVISGQTFLNGLANGNNVTVSGKISGNIFYGSGIYLTGVTLNSTNWLFFANQGILATNIPIISATTISGITYYGDGSNLTGIQGSGGTANTFTTGATLINDIAYFNRNDSLSAYTLNLSAFTSNSNIDGGSPSSVYLITQKIDGGTP